MIYCGLLGIPIIKENEKTIYLPSGKVSGLFYYILCKKVVTREMLATLFWPMSSEENAKISLRNALYKIRRAFKQEIVLTPNKSIIKLNMNLDIVIDLDIFERDPIENLNLYKGKFLKGIYIKNIPEYDDWLLEQRIYYSEIYNKNLEKKINFDIENDRLDSIENDIGKLIAIDNYNEKAYLLLMNYYSKIGRYDKIVNEYYKVEEILKNELGIQPCEEIKDIYRETLRKLKVKEENNKKEILFYDRYYEKNILKEYFQNFKEGKDYKSIIITGEIGIGKTILKKEALKEYRDEFIILESNCYYMEQKISLAPWKKIILSIYNILKDEGIEVPISWEQIMDNMFPKFEDRSVNDKFIVEHMERFTFDRLYNILYSVLELIGKNKKIIIVIEDIQWADKYSLKLLINLALYFNCNVMFLLTSNEENLLEIKDFIISMKMAEKIIELKLEPFEKEIVAKIIKNSLNEELVPQKVIDDIYEKSQGNALFIEEYIELYKNRQKDLILTDKINDVLNIKFSTINTHERHVLEKISLFYKEVDLKMLLKFGVMSAYDLIKAINHLKNKHIIEVKNENGVTNISFTNRIYKDYINNNLSGVSRKIMNLEIAKVLELEINQRNIDETLITQIKNHYEFAGEKIKVLEYEVKILSYYLNFTHELFPNLNDFNLNKQVKVFMKGELVLKKLEKIEQEILYAKNYMYNDENIELIDNIEREFLYNKCRYLIREGNYEEGKQVLNRVMDIARRKDEKDVLLNCHKQFIFYGIQINNPEVMVNHIRLAMKLANEIEDDRELGIIIRLYGLYHLMKGNIATAEMLFNKSINNFCNSVDIENANSISIAADYNYIGEIRKVEGNYDEANILFDKAINLCEKGGASCLSVFYMNKGKVYFLMNDFENMRKCLEEALKIVEMFDSFWESSVINAYLAYYFIIKEDYDNALLYIRRAQNEITKINNPRDYGIIYFIEYLIKEKLSKECDKKSIELKRFLNKGKEFYFYSAIRNLDEFRDIAELKYLKSYRS